MKFFVLAVAMLLTAIAQSAAAAEPWAESPRDKAVMLYFTKTFGAPQRKEMPLQFGLRWQQGSMLADVAPTELIGLRFNSLGHRGLSAGGAMILRLDSMKDEDQDGNVDSSWDSMSELTIYLVGVLGVAAVLCATEIGICTKSRRRVSPGESPGLE